MAADLFGVDHAVAADAADLAGMIAQASNGPRLIEVKTDRAANVAVHEAAWRAVAGAV